MRTLGCALCVALLTGAALTVPPGVAPAMAQDEPEMLSTVGVLVDVNIEEQTLRVQAEDGTVWNFMFNDETMVAGSEGGTAGLAANEGVNVTVEYTMDGDIATAHSIRLDS